MFDDLMLGTGIYTGYKLLNSSSVNRENVSRINGSGSISEQFARSGLTLDRKTQTVGSSVISQIMALEEASPLHILRTFQLSNLMQPFTQVTKLNEEIHLTGNQIRGQQFFYDALLKQTEKERKNKINRILRNEDLKNGFIFKDNKLYGVDPVTKKINLKDIVLEDARLVLASQKNGQIVSQNHILRKWAEGFNGKLDYRQSINNPLMVIGGTSSRGTLGKQLNAYLKLGMEVGYKTLDNPIAGFEELLTGLGADLTPLFKSNFWQKAKALANIQMGTGGVYNLGHKESLARMSKNLAFKGAGAYIGYQVLDSFARTLAPDGNAFDSGLLAGLGNIYTESRIKFAQIWSDRFQNYKKFQEEMAPGSTDLLTLLGMPLGTALMGAQVGYFGRISTSIRKGQGQAAAKYSVETISPLLNKMGITTPTTPMKRNAIVGGVIGGLTVLPFLPRSFNRCILSRVKRKIFWIKRRSS